MFEQIGIGIEQIGLKVLVVNLFLLLFSVDVNVDVTVAAVVLVLEVAASVNLLQDSISQDMEVGKSVM